VRVRSFPPLIAAGARVLILGSMPGLASLAADQYYAHPRNQFWPLLGGLLGFDPQAPYAQRVQALQAHGIAVWDVLAECRRSGSLDSAIDRASEHANDIPALLRAHPTICTILLNGGKAAASLRRHHPQLAIPSVALPSTSPAHASRSHAVKQAAWRDALARAGVRCDVVSG
jgi:hypoxanthine-DNA glycosylase